MSRIGSRPRMPGTCDERRPLITRRARDSDNRCRMHRSRSSAEPSSASRFRISDSALEAEVAGLRSRQLAESSILDHSSVT